MSAKETMTQVIKENNLMHIASIDENGNPSVRGVDFAAGKQENILYFVTKKDSRKIAQFQNNHNIAIAIDKDCLVWEDLEKLKYIKASGTATIIEDPKEAQEAFGLLVEKFPFLANLPGDPLDFTAVRVELNNVLVTDNTIHFGHTKEVIF